MALTWDITRCKSDVDLNEKVTQWPITYTIIMSTMNVGIGEITDKNVAEFYARMKLLEKVYGSLLYVTEGDNPEDYSITPLDVKRRIGLKTNVFPTETQASFIKRHCTSIIKSALWDFHRAEKEEVA